MTHGNKYHREYLAGFAELAAFEASDSESAIFQRFRWLSCRNLIYMQSELLSLERKFVACDEYDAKAIHGDDIEEGLLARGSATSWDRLVENAKADQYKVRLDMVKDLRSLMKEYRKQDVQLRTMGGSEPDLIPV